ATCDPRGCHLVNSTNESRSPETLDLITAEQRPALHKSKALSHISAEIVCAPAADAGQDLLRNRSRWTLAAATALKVPALALRLEVRSTQLRHGHLIGPIERCGKRACAALEPRRRHQVRRVERRVIDDVVDDVKRRCVPTVLRPFHLR